MLSASKIHADDTPVPVLALGNGKTKTGRLWTYVRDDRPAAQTTAPAVWFAYSEDRKGEHPRQHLWMEKMLRSLSAKSENASATRYALSHWRALTRYVDDGLLEIDNSAAERALRAVAIGRKNYLFFGAGSGGQRAASFYTQIGTAKLNGFDPAFYLRTIMARIAEHPINRIAELLPWSLPTSLQSKPADAA